MARQQDFIMARIAIQELNISQLANIDPSQQYLADSATIRELSTQEAQAINGGWRLRIFWLGIFPFNIE